jgi:hypothetical protein
VPGLRRSTRTAPSATTRRSPRSPTGSICPAGPRGSRLIVRRERPHPGAQLSFTDHDGYRFQAILTDHSDEDIAILECRHRQRAHVEDRIRDDKDTGLAKFPFREFALNQVWLEIVLLAHDPIVWTQALLLDGELAKAEPKPLRYRLLHVAAPTRIPPTPRQAAPAARLALGHRARRRLPQAQRTPSRNRLTPPGRQPAPSSSPRATATIAAALKPPVSRPAVPRNRPSTPPAGQRRHTDTTDPSPAPTQSHSRAYCVIRVNDGFAP